MQNGEDVRIQSHVMFWPSGRRTILKLGRGTQQRWVASLPGVEIKFDIFGPKTKKQLESFTTSYVVFQQHFLY
jgi:hypothetical protein